MPTKNMALTYAFIGSFVGKRVLQKVTLRMVQLIVAIAMLVIGIGLVLGLLWNPRDCLAWRAIFRIPHAS